MEGKNEGFDSWYSPILVIITLSSRQVRPTRTVPRVELLKFYKNTHLRSMNCHLPMGDGANNPANAPTAAEPKAIKPSGIVAAVLMLK